jgi:hypothetical protein
MVPANRSAQKAYLESALPTDLTPVAFQLTTHGKDQGYVSDRNAGAWSWYSAQLVAPPDADDGEERVVHEWCSHCNAMAGQTHETLVGDVIDLRRWRLERGDRLRVMLNAQFGAWSCEAVWAELRVFVSV